MATVECQNCCEEFDSLDVCPWCWNCEDCCNCEEED